MPKIPLAIQYRHCTGKFNNVKKKDDLKAQIELEKLIIQRVSSSSLSLSSGTKFSSSTLVTGLLAIMTISAVLAPTVQTAPTLSPNKQPETNSNSILDPVHDMPKAMPIHGGESINNNSAKSECLVVIRNPKGRCTGAAISETVVVTAQHCVEKIDLSENGLYKFDSFYSGDQITVHEAHGDINSNQPNTHHKAEKIFLQANFFKDNYLVRGSAKSVNDMPFNDVAVIKTKTSLFCTPKYQLPNTNEIDKIINKCSLKKARKQKGEPAKFQIRGYGQVNEADSAVRHFAREANLICSKYENKHNGARFVLNGADSAGSGDSGGPLTKTLKVNSVRSEFLIGVCSTSTIPSNKTTNWYSSLKPSLNSIQEIIDTGDTAGMWETSCVISQQHFSFLWDSAQKISLTNRCNQDRQVFISMGSGANGRVLSSQNKLEGEKVSIIIKAGKTQTLYIDKKNKPVFIFSKKSSEQS